MSSFRQELLPPPLDFYEKEEVKPGRPNHKGWCPGRCPFHNSKRGKSFAVHIDGAFVCRGCGVRGHDVIAFLRLRYGLSFKQACQQLGAWREDGKPVKLRPGPPTRYLMMDFVIDGIQYHAELPDEPRTELRWLRGFYADAKDRLTEIRQGETEKFEGEEEVQWGIMASSWELIQLELADAR
jgi:CHC2-type zinc finger protein